MERYVCIHAHFYQPPRENPWLEAIELQDSAYPYHDWNERITAECYAPNARSRVLDERNRVAQILNNYSRISFNFGPTLLSWLEAKAPDVYEAVLEADRESRERFSGHGSALAQAYNHMILPLANRRDKETQVVWGLRDFERRFGRAAEGLWLPETAVDVETLEVLAAHGLRFTILAPSQARRVRRTGGRTWRDVSGGRVDPTQAYEVRLPSGARMALFFYDGPIARAVAFEGLLHKGEYLAGRLTSAFAPERAWPQLVHIATDGETYGHHHRFGEMALSYALRHIESEGVARLTNYGEYLALHPPTHQVEIVENTAWSCVHSVERWWRDCGCSSGGHQGWNQAWREPLRNALDWLRDTVASRFEEAAGGLLRDPWAARNDYVEVIAARTPEAREAFLDAHALRPLGDGEKVRVFQLMELQRQAQLMYTSCGWFFDEISGLETVQVLQYAGAALQLARQALDLDLEADFRERLSQARSNVPELGDGARIFDRLVVPARVDFEKVGAHYAIASLFDGDGQRERVYCYTAQGEDHRVFRAGKPRLAVGRVRLTSQVTLDSAVLSYAVMHVGDHNVNGGVRPFRGEDAFEELVEEAVAAFDRGELAEVIRLMDRHFGESNYSLKSLFRDEQRRILSLILDATLSEASAMYGQIYEHYAPLMRYLGDLGVPLPRALEHTAEFVLDGRLRALLSDDAGDPAEARAAIETARRERVALDDHGLGYALQQRLDRAMARLCAAPDDASLLREVEELVDLARTGPLVVSLWRPQNLFDSLLRTRLAAAEPARLEALRGLGEKLAVRFPGSD